MRFRLTLIFAALVVLLGAMIFVIQDRRTDVSAPAMAVAPAEQSAAPSAPAAVPAVAPALTLAPAAPVVEQLPQVKAAPMVHVDASGSVQYIARAGDTLSQLAIALLGSDTKEHREAIIAANVALQSNPDRVLEGQAYSIAAASNGGTNDAAISSPAAASATPQENATSVKPASDIKADGAATGPRMKYTAQPGDTVSTLAANLLGADTKANRDGIIAGNTSLQEDPNRLIAGKSYTIVARNGLAANPNAPQAQAPATQPEADDAARLGVGRMLRYTAQPGDTVSKLAVVLLGSDTASNRELIINSNANLKQNPDHLVAGQTYWIAAPTADGLPR